MCIVADEPTRSQEVFSSTESSDEDEDDFEDEGDTNEGEDEQEEEEEEDDDEVFVLQSDLNFPPKQKLQQQQVKKKRNGEISPPSFAAATAAAAFPPGKNNSAANHGVKMVEGLGGDVADVLEVGHDLCAGYSDVAGNRKRTSLKSIFPLGDNSWEILTVVEAHSICHCNVYILIEI